MWILCIEEDVEKNLMREGGLVYSISFWGRSHVIISHPGSSSLHTRRTGSIPVLYVRYDGSLAVPKKTISTEKTLFSVKTAYLKVPQT